MCLEHQAVIDDLYVKFQWKAHAHFFVFYTSSLESFEHIERTFLALREFREQLYPLILCFNDI